MICFKKHDAEIEALRAERESLRIELAVLKTKVGLIEPENESLKALSKKLWDRICTGMGFAPIYEEPKPYVPPSEPTRPRNSTRDALEAAQAAEDRAYEEMRKQRLTEAIEAVNGGTQ